MGSSRKSKAKVGVNMFQTFWIFQRWSDVLSYEFVTGVVVFNGFIAGGENKLHGLLIA